MCDELAWRKADDPVKLDKLRRGVAIHKIIMCLYSCYDAISERSRSRSETVRDRVTLTETVTPYPMYAFRFTRKHEIEPAQRRARTSQLLKPQCAGAPSTAVVCTARLWLR